MEKSKIGKEHDFDGAWKSILEAFEKEVVEVLFPEIKEDILVYNFKTIDIESISLEKISEDNPIKLVFKMAKSLLETGTEDEEIYQAKINLAEELVNYDKVKNAEQIKALVDFLEYLFLIEDSDINRKYEDYKRQRGGAFKMSIEEIRRIHYVNEGREEGREEGRAQGKEQIAMDMLQDNVAIETIVKYTKLSIEEVEALAKKMKI